MGWPATMQLTSHSQTWGVKAQLLLRSASYHFKHLHQRASANSWTHIRFCPARKYYGARGGCVILREGTAHGVWYVNGNTSESSHARKRCQESFRCITGSAKAKMRLCCACDATG
jgi:hypothetical protein